jgi:Asp-tRNA(Asn)/Glu-tRNA(Gln) amidotransferase A subunit family amidase
VPALWLETVHVVPHRAAQLTPSAHGCDVHDAGDISGRGFYADAMSQLLSLTLTELTRTLASRQASPVELMREVFATVDAKNPELNAIVEERGREALLDDARAAEARIAGGSARPLEGIPFGVKDLEDAAGLKTTHGSKLFADFVPDRDSTQVERLKAAGGILYGKTNAPEFGTNGITRNLVYGVTRSPWDPAVSPGGSSGGSSAALTAEMLPLVTASDGGGSIRIPASFVGAYGLKPSYGRVPRGPFAHFALGATVHYGPLTKTVEDAALILDVTAGYDAHDPASLPSVTTSYRDALKSPLGRKLKFAYSPDFGYAVVQSDVAALVEDGVRLFERLGHSVKQISGGPPDMNGEWGILSAFEIGASLHAHRPARDADFGRALLETFKYTENMSQPLWGSMMDKRARVIEFFAGVFDEYDAIITPTTPYDAPPAKGPFPTETEGRPQITASVASFTVPTNLSWHPSASLRAGLSKRGLPVGLQVIVPHHREDLLLAISRAFEAERPAHPYWPGRR